MPAPARPRRRKPPTDGIQDAIPPAEVPARVQRSGSAPDPNPEESGATPPPGADPTDGRVPGTPARQLLEAQAGRLDERAWPSALYGSLGVLFGTGVGTYAYAPFLDKFVSKVGPAGPVERMPAERLLLSRHCLGHLQVKGMGAGNRWRAGRSQK